MSSRRDTQLARISGVRLGKHLPRPALGAVKDIVSQYFPDVKDAEKMLKCLKSAGIFASIAYAIDHSNRSGLSDAELLVHLNRINSLSNDLAEALTGQRIASHTFPVRVAHKINFVLTEGIQIADNAPHDALDSLKVLNERVQLALTELMRTDRVSGEPAIDRKVSGAANTNRTPHRPQGTSEIRLDMFLEKIMASWEEIRGKKVALTVNADDGDPTDNFFHFVEKYFTSDPTFENNTAYFARALQNRCQGFDKKG